MVIYSLLLPQGNASFAFYFARMTNNHLGVFLLLNSTYLSLSFLHPAKAQRPEGNNLVPWWIETVWKHEYNQGLEASLTWILPLWCFFPDYTSLAKFSESFEVCCMVVFLLANLCILYRLKPEKWGAGEITQKIRAHSWDERGLWIPGSSRPMSSKHSWGDPKHTWK